MKRYLRAAIKSAVFLFTIGLLITPFTPVMAAVTVPEYWTGSESGIFFIATSIAFATLIRLKVLRLRVKR
jgi:hypothetical protein